MTLVLNLIIAAWLFVSAFVLPHTTASAWNALLVAVAIAAVAFIAYAAPGRPGLRWTLAVVAVWLLAAVMIVPHLSLASAANEVLVAAALALVSFWPPRRIEKEGHAHG
ncbi:MAG TPA: hypothetical protein VFP50_05815 [Anaeromyxobacteraceae bacterium]|nr:hypothetical protein [Anaeromyxobacteraceae bacterium]